MKTWPERIGRTGKRESEGSAPLRSRRRSRRSAGIPETGELDRFLQSPSALCSFMGLTLGVFVSRKFFILPLAVAVTLGQELLKERLVKVLAVRRSR